MEYNESNLIADYYSQHYEELKSFVGARLQYSHETDDIVQNVFLRLLCMDKMITPITLPCLVYTVAKNLIFDYWRHRRCVEEYEHFICKSDWRGSKVQDGESVFSALEITELLERGIARLGEKQRMVYKLNIYEGLQVSEISTRLHLNYKNVENRLGAARKEIRSYVRHMLAS